MHKNFQKLKNWKHKHFLGRGRKKRDQNTNIRNRKRNELEGLTLRTESIRILTEESAVMGFTVTE